MESYSKALAQFFEGKGFRMTEVSGAEPRVVSLNAATEFDSQ